MVVGLGGGSVLDAAKAVAGLMTNGGEALDLPGGRRPRDFHSSSPRLRFSQIPTTAGTGSEVTRNAVLADRARG